MYRKQKYIIGNSSKKEQRIGPLNVSVGARYLGSGRFVIGAREATCALHAATAAHINHSIKTPHTSNRHPHQLFKISTTLPAGPSTPILPAQRLVSCSSCYSCLFRTSCTVAAGCDVAAAKKWKCACPTPHRNFLTE